MHPLLLADFEAANNIAWGSSDRQGSEIIRTSCVFAVVLFDMGDAFNIAYCKEVAFACRLFIGKRNKSYDSEVRTHNRPFEEVAEVNRAKFRTCGMCWSQAEGGPG